MPDTKVLKINPVSPEKGKIGDAVSVLLKGGIVAFPTETVYGLAALYDDPASMERLRAVKSREAGKPFTVHIAKTDMIEALGCEIDFMSGKLIKRFWPGPLTVILKFRDTDGTLGFRMPECEIARRLIDSCARPIVAPSANQAGQKSPRTAQEVFKALNGRIDLILDGGPTKMGRDSTVINATELPVRILREGAIPAALIKDAWHESGETV